MEELPATDRKIIKCMEYYFGDFNLPKDKHLLELIKKDQDGWVPMEEMLKFNKLRSLCEDAAHICEVLKKSPNDLLEVSEDNSKVRRSRKLPEDTKEHRQDVNNRTLHISGFPTDASFDEIEDCLEAFGNTENIFMKRDKQKKNENGRPAFKGSVFVLFAKLEDAKKLVDTAELKFKDQALTAVFKNDHFKKKDEERKQNRKKGKGEDNGKKEEAEEEEQEEQPITKNAVLVVEGVTDEISLEDLKVFWSDFGHVSWVQYDKGDSKAYIRFKEENMAGEALEKAKKDEEEELKIKNVAITASVATGEEEEKYWQRLREDVKKRWKQNPKKGRFGQKNQRKRPWGGNKNSHDSGPSNKKQKV